MANLIDIRRRIRSVKNTQQITKAMKMVAASKLRRAQERVTAARPYAATLQATLSSLAAALPAGAEGAPAHPLLARREEKNVVLVVVTGDKGLCGAFNTNVLRAAGQFLDERSGSQKTAPRLVVLGRKGHDYFKRRPYQVLDSRPGLFQRFGYDTAAEIARSLAGRFTSGEVDAVYVVFNEFRSVISQVVTTRRLLPLELPEASGPARDVLFEPSPAAILDRLVPRNLEFQLYRVLLESNASEQGARMTAMDGASKNAGEMIDHLTLTYNRARQARITKELIEIVSGAAALA
ncbi:MAG: ATP synthase F1 subunit gamma [Acidobacteria bacterium]|nr:MAG: ATP synthase F1 subunit gamma [Acidobacteriota bacterium]